VRTPGIEYMALRLKQRRMTGNEFIDQLDHVFHTIVIDGDPAGCLHKSAVPVDRVVLRYSLNYTPDVQSMRQLRDKALALVEPGGEVVALARACENGEELAQRITASGAPLALSNLSNREIVGLTPQAGVFLVSTATFVPVKKREENWQSANSDRFLDFATNVFHPRKALDIRFVPETRFTTRIIDVGLTWQKPKHPPVSKKRV